MATGGKLTEKIKSFISGDSDPLTDMQISQVLEALKKSGDYVVLTKDEYNVLKGPSPTSTPIVKTSFQNPFDASALQMPKVDVKLPFFSGHGDVWHGHADILVKGSVVKVGSEEDGNCEPEIGSGEPEDGSGKPEDGSGEPLQKKMRTESVEDNESSESAEDYDSSVVKGVKKNAIGDHALSQILAQTIVNAFAEVNKNEKLSRSFIPSFIATSKVIRITMYNCELDSLIMTGDLNIFTRDKPILKASTILSIWIALNFENYFDKISDLFHKFMKGHTQSNLKEHAGKNFEIYKEKCTKPMSQAERISQTEKNKCVNFEWRDQCISSFLRVMGDTLSKFEKSVRNS